MNLSVLQKVARTIWLKRTVAGVLLLAIVTSLMLVSGRFAPLTAGNTNVLANGNFEDGFSNQAGCGMVGTSWHCFTNGGAVNYGYYDDSWSPVVANGGHSQLIELNTKGVSDASHDRYAGIYQTVRVVDWAQYTLSLKGMIRTTEMEGDPWRYRVEVGWTSGYTANWQAVTNWTDVGWDTYYERTSPGDFSDFTTTLTAPGDYVTVYIRVWKKWGVPEMELDVNLDAISLTGPSPYGYHPPVTAPPAYPATKTPAAKPPIGCGDANLVYNGDFESGFNSTALGAVGKSWGFFTNSGATNYGFYDDMWALVVADGSHSQLIELNTKGLAAADADRYAGIYQKIGHLKKGATYQVTIKGMLRGEGGGDDPNRFQAQWGFNPNGDLDWTHVSNWQTANLGPIHERTSPGTIATYTAKFVAPDNEIVLFIRGWKKWGTHETEMDLNLDGIRLTGCTTKPLPKPSPCVYVVKPGDSLSKIAAHYGVSLHALARANYITNYNLIYVGQKLHIPGCVVRPTPGPGPTVTPIPGPGGTTYTVRPGDTLSAIAGHFGVDVYVLAEVNGITNLNIIYVGQVLVIPADP